jgi:hypothetical protein
MKRPTRLAALPLSVAAALGLFAVLDAGPASAHHTTVECVDPLGVWRVTNSEADKSMTFTSPQGPAGSIPAGGSTLVEFVGSSLTIVGTWSNGATNTSTGEGDCDDTPPTSSSTTSSTTSTLPTTSSTTSTTAPPSTSTTTTTEVGTPPTLPPTTSSTTQPPQVLTPKPSAPATNVTLPETR